MEVMEKTPEQLINDCATKHKVTMVASFVPFSQSRSKDNDHKSLNWEITLYRDGISMLSTDYGAGEKAKRSTAPVWKSPCSCAASASRPWPSCGRLARITSL